MEIFEPFPIRYRSLTKKDICMLALGNECLYLIFSRLFTYCIFLSLGPLSLYSENERIMTCYKKMCFLILDIVIDS